MTLEISPVLAGTYDAPDYVPSHNIASTQADATADADAVDSRRYTKFDRSATEAGSTTSFSFGDFLDMINPLEHIPVLSSIYREVTGESINPVARVVGDVLYGGVVGIASAVMGVAGGVGDAVMEAQTGKDSTGNVVAELFENDQSPSSTATTQLAQTGNAGAPDTTQPTTQTAAQTNARAKLQAASIVAATSSAVQASMPSSGTSSPAAQMASASSTAGSGVLGGLTGDPSTGLSPLNGTKMFALDPKKLPYGGVMAPPLQGNNMALALANSAPGMQMNHTVYTGRLMKGVKPSPMAAASAPPPAPSTSPPVAANWLASTAPPSASATDTLPASLMNDIAALRAINQYRSTASQTGSSGTSLNVVN